MYICSALFLFFRSLFVSRISLATETLVLRQQLLVLTRTVKRPKLRRRDRLFLVCRSKLWGGWREALIIVKPDCDFEVEIGFGSTNICWPHA
jgi:hypothetical protein